MDPMDISEYQESIRKDFWAMTENFERNFGHLNLEKIAQLKAKIADIADLLNYREKERY